MSSTVIEEQDTNRLVLSEKYIAFLKHRTSSFEFLEGTTFAGKTTVGSAKFMFEVARSKQRLHIISGLDLGVIEKNIVQPENGLMDIFGDLLLYWSNGNKTHGLPHLEYATPNGVKIIYLLGYDDKRRWKKALGGQYGCVFIDEINIADMEYIREVMMRSDYRIATLNPDDPELQIYKEYIDRARPLPEYAHETPDNIMQQLNQEPKDGWTHWFFSFDHNAALTEEKKNNIISSVPVGTKIFKNKIQGLRGRSEGLVFPNFTYDNNVMSEDDIRSRYEFNTFTCGVDTAYSSQSNDTVAFIFQGIARDGTLITLEEKVMNNKDTEKPFAPSDVAQDLYHFLGYCSNKWGTARHVYVDSADQATLSELRKMKKRQPSVYEYVNSDKRMKIIDRINLQLGWIDKQMYIVSSSCTYHIHEINNYTWKGSEPEDANDHTINANQYAWIPYTNKVGIRVKRQDREDKIKALRRL